MEGLGINTTSLLIQIANIALFYFIFTTFLLKPIIKVLDDRKARIEHALKDAEKVKKELADLEKEKIELNKKAKLIEKQAVEKAKEEAEAESAKIITQARDKAAQIILNAESMAKNIEKEIIKRAEENQLRIISAAIERILGEKMNEQEIRARYQMMFNELNK